MNIFTLLTPKNELVYEFEDATIRQLIEKMTYYGYTTLPVLNRDGSFFQTISEGDLLRKIVSSGLNLDSIEKIRVRDIPIKRNYQCLDITATFDDVYRLSTSQNFIPLVDDQGIFIGIIRRASVVSYLKQEYEKYVQ